MKRVTTVLAAVCFAVAAALGIPTLAFGNGDKHDDKPNYCHTQTSQPTILFSQKNDDKKKWDPDWCKPKPTKTWTPKPCVTATEEAQIASKKKGDWTPKPCPTTTTTSPTTSPPTTTTTTTSPPSTTTPPVETDTVTPVGETLPHTGTDNTPVVLFAGVLLVFGIALYMAGRAWRRSDDKA